MIENHLKFKDQTTEGLGYNNVPPPFNDNYTPPIEPVILRRPVPVSQTPVPVSTKIEKPQQVMTTKPNESNASTTCADTVLVEDWTEEEDSDSDTVNILSKTNVLNSVISNVSVVSDIKTVDSVPLFVLQ